MACSLGADCSSFPGRRSKISRSWDSLVVEAAMLKRVCIWRNASGRCHRVGDFGRAGRRREFPPIYSSPLTDQNGLRD